LLVEQLIFRIELALENKTCYLLALIARVNTKIINISFIKKGGNGNTIKIIAKS
jgi:hypothetical protein